MPYSSRTQRGLPLERNPLGIKNSMWLIDRWLHINFDAKLADDKTQFLFWNKQPEQKSLLTWKQAIERGGGIGPDRLISYDQLLDSRFSRSAAFQWFVEGDQKDYSFYSDPSYAYLTLFCYIIMTGRTISTEAWDLAQSGAISRLTPFLAGGTIWEAVTLLRRGAKNVVVSNYDTPQVAFYRWAAREIGVDDRIRFVNERCSPFPHEVLITNEYLEHFENPITEIKRLMENKPALVYHRSGFNLVGHGHPIPLDFSEDKSVKKLVYSHSEADEIFDKYCASIPDYEFSMVTGGWRDSTRRLKRLGK